MGAKGSKGSPSTNSQGQKEIINHIRRTIRKVQPGPAATDMTTLGKQFKATSMLDPEQIIFQLNVNKSLLNTIRNDSQLQFRQLLRSLKISVNSKVDSVEQVTCLHLAAMLGKTQIISVLLSSLDIDVNALNRSGDSSLILAIKCGSDETTCYNTVVPLVQDSRCHIARTNAVGSTALSIAIAKGFSSLVKLLVSNGKVRVYTPIDLAMAIKLALIYEREDLVEIIMNELDGSSSQAEFTNLLESNPELNSLGEALKKFNIAGSSFEEVSYKESGVQIEAVSSNQRQPDFMNTISTTAGNLSSKVTKDNSGQSLIIGDLVQILSEEVVAKMNPRIASEYDFIEGIADHKAHVHDIDSEGDIYMDVLDTPYAGHVNPKCVRFISHGPTKKLEGGQSVTVGYYVSVDQDVERVEELAKGHGGWKPEMAQFCGRTGKIRKIDKDGDVFVHFPNGAKHCFNPKALRLSSAKDIEAKDLDGNWIRKGAVARVTANEQEFRLLQEEIEMGRCDKYSAILGKLVYVRKLRLFLQYTDAVVIPYDKLELDMNKSGSGIVSYNLNPKCLQLVPGHESSSLPTATAAEDKGQAQKQRKDTDDIGYVSREDRLSDFSGRSRRNDSTQSIQSVVSTLSGSSNYEAVQLIPRKDLVMKKKLGEGGFGCVTSGSWKGTECAIKQIRPIVLSDMDYVNILKEARIQYGLKHPNIVQLYGISYDNDLWMVMQLVNGMDLHSLLFGADAHGNHEKISFGNKLKICLQTTNAISYLHEKGFIHNDMKPENIMIERRTGHVYVCDFGITRYLGEMDMRSYSQQYTSSFGGTLPYIAPECFQKDPVENRYLRPTFKSDIWSLGAVFVELFIEMELFPNEKALCLYKIMNDYSGVKAMLKLVDDSTIRNMLTKALDPEPTSRPNADELGSFFSQMIEKRAP